MRSILPPSDQAQTIPVGSNSLQKILEKTGRFPGLDLVIKPLDGGKEFTFNKFIAYQFSSSILIPVDAFSFQVAAPDLQEPVSSLVRSGDVCTLNANNQPLATGIIDTTEVETDGSYGEKIAMHGRDLMSQLEDQDAISQNNAPLWANNYTIKQVLDALVLGTRIKSSYDFRGISTKTYLFATEPGETKLSALQRFLQPLNSLAWTGPSGKMIVGKPNFKQDIQGRLFVIKSQRVANVLSIKSTRSPATIPTSVLPIWAGQETVQNRISPAQALYNAAQDVQRLRKLGHLMPKTAVVSTPQGNSPQDLAEINKFQAGSSTVMELYAKSQLARENHRELIVQVAVAGHYNESGIPYTPDQTYHITYDRDGIDEKMYLFQVDYSFDESKSQTSTLYFCRLGTLVADVEI